MDFEETSGTESAELLNLVKAAVKRYWMLSLGPALVLCALVVILSFRLPPYYTVDSQVYLKPQRLQTKLVNQDNDVELERQRDALIGLLLSRTTLQKIVERHNLYPELRARRGVNELVRHFRSQIQTVPVRTATGGKTSALFKLKFSYRDPDKTFQVVKELTDLFIEESELATSTEVNRNVEFFDEQLAEARRDLERTEKALNEFVQQNSRSLPQNLEANIARLEGLEGRFQSNRLQIASFKERISSLQDELRLVTSSGNGDEFVDPSNPVQAKKQLEAALSRLKLRYTSQHPDVIRTKARIRSLDKLIKSGKTGSGDAGLASASPEARRLSRSISDQRIRAKELERENEGIEAEMESLEKVVDMTPALETKMRNITRDYETTKERYERLKLEKESVSLKSDMIQSQRGAQFTVLEQPLRPSRGEASGPPRAMIAGGGMVAAIALMIALPIVFFLTNPSYKLVSQVESDLGLPVLGVIPPMETPHAVCVQNKMIVFSLLISILFLIVGGVALFVLV